MANRSWPGYGRSGTSPGREVSAAVRVAGAGGVARERRGSGDRRAPSPGRAPVRAGVEQPPALGAAQVNSRAEPTSRSRGRLLPAWLAARARPGAASWHLSPRFPTKRAGPTAGPALPLAGKEPGRRARPLRISGGGPLSGPCWRWRCSAVRPSPPRRRRSPPSSRISVKPAAGRQQLLAVTNCLASRSNSAWGKSSPRATPRTDTRFPRSMSPRTASAATVRPG